MKALDVVYRGVLTFHEGNNVMLNGKIVDWLTIGTAQWEDTLIMTGPNFFI